MAFQFVPNAEGEFEEGMRQTNPETGVEYIFTNSAWRPLGPKIEDQFDDLDERYVLKSGDVMHGELQFDRGENTPPNLLIYPNIGDTASSFYALNNGALRFRSVSGGNPDDQSTTHIAMGKTGESGGPETYIYHLQDPQEDNWAANKKYVDEQINNINVPTDDLMTLKGTQLLEDGNWRLQQANSTGGTYSYISIDTDELKLYHLKEPTSSHHAATKKYMDDKIELLTNSSIPPNNALQSEIDTLRSDVDETFTTVFEDITDVEDDIKKSLDTQDAIKSDLSRLTIENVEQNAKIVDLTARLEALENP